MGGEERVGCSSQESVRRPRSSYFQADKRPPAARSRTMDKRLVSSRAVAVPAMRVLPVVVALHSGKPDFGTFAPDERGSSTEMGTVDPSAKPNSVVIAPLVRR